MQNKELYTHVFKYDGQACVCITQLEQGNEDNCVHAYDLDAARIFLIDVRDVIDAPKLRQTEREDFEFSAIRGSRYADDAWEICNELFD